MNKIIGNYLSQANKSFPVDCETLDYIAGNATLAEMLGNIAGDKMILYGCDAVNGGVSRKEGYVFLRTKDYPEGEVLRFEGGSTASGLHVVKNDVAVSANGYSFPKAYTARYLAAGYGSEQYKWEDFEEVKTNRTLWEALSGLQKAFSDFSAEPLGIVKMWAGQKVPDGYHLCDGSQLSVEEYPELYAAIGTTFNSAKNPDGNIYTTERGQFRLPDLRGRFVVGSHDTDDDYREYGTAGGEKKVLLSSGETPLPVHSHENSVGFPSGGDGSHRHYYTDDRNVKDRSGSIMQKYHIEEVEGFGNGSGDGSGAASVYITGFTDDMDYSKHTHSIDVTIKASEDKRDIIAHENRPPYYVLAYIMKLK